MSEIEKIIEGPSGNLQLRVQSGTKSSLFVMCHPHPLYQGSMDNKVVTMAVKALSNLGVSTIRFNYRGVGSSQGNFGRKCHYRPFDPQP